jgi:hypothetical protein
VDIKNLAEVNSPADIKSPTDIESPAEVKGLVGVECYSASLYILVLGFKL